MRIGVHVGANSVRAAALVDSDVIEAAEPTVGLDDLGDAVARVLRRVRTRLGEEISSVIVDVSEVLTPDDSADVVAVLIEPRIPVVPRRHGWERDGLRVDTAQIRGGHTALGDELVPIDEEALLQLAATVPAGAHLILSAAGAPCNPVHERRAAELLRAAAPVASVTESHTFFSDSILVREHTAVVNALLLRQGEQLSGILADAVARVAGDDARVFVSRNDGGCSSLARLSVTPVHSVRSGIAAAVRGAATLAGRSSGRLVLALPDAVLIGEFTEGMLPAVARPPLPAGRAALASNFAQVVPLTDLLISGSTEAPVAVAAEGCEGALGAFGLEPALITGHALVALGASTAPLSHWHNGIARIVTANDVAKALREGAQIARAALVAAGAAPDDVRVTESRVLATSYDEAQVVRIRVRTVAATPGRHSGRRATMRGAA